MGGDPTAAAFWDRYGARCGRGDALSVRRGRVCESLRRRPRTRGRRDGVSAS